MKYFLKITVLSLIFVSCMNISEENVIPNKTINIIVNNIDWRESLDINGLNRYYYCKVRVPELDQSVFNNGNVNCYKIESNYLIPLTYVQHLENPDAIWTRTISYQYTLGYLYLTVTNSDFAIDPPESMQFKLVLSW